MKPFYVICEEHGKFVPYDVMPYLINSYRDDNKHRWKVYKCPVTFDEYKEYIKRNSMYMWWSKCEYEIILMDWPCQKKQEKWDIHKQLMMNIDIITEIFIKNIEDGNKK